MPFGPVEVPPFPVHLLSPWLRQAAEAFAEDTQTPVDAAGTLMLAAVAVCSAKRYAVERKATHVEPLNLYTVVAMPPASGKSPIFKLVFGPVAEYEAEQQVATKVERASRGSRRKVLEKEIERLTARAANDTGPERLEAQVQLDAKVRDLSAFGAVVEPRLLVNDATPERLTGILAEQGGAIGLVGAEGGAFGMIAGRYSKGSVPNVDVYLSGHSGDALRSDRQGKDSVRVSRPALTMALTVQPTVLRGMAGQAKFFREVGLTARFLYAVPVSRVGSRRLSPEAASAPVVDAYGRHLRALLTMPTERDGDGELRPKSLRLGAEAAKRFDAAWAAHERRLGEDGDLTDIGDWAGKMMGSVVLRLAGLLHLGDTITAPEMRDDAISDDAMERALKLADYYLAHARAAYRMMDADDQDDTVKDAGRILRWAKEHNAAVLEPRELWQDLKTTRCREMSMLDAALKLLVRHGWLRQLDAQRAPQQKGAPERERYAVHPDALRVDAASGRAAAA